MIGTCVARPRQTEAPNYQVRALHRGIAVLESLAAVGTGLTLGELSSQVAMPKATAFRILECLRQEGLVTREGETGRYKLGIRLFELGCAYLAASPLQETATPFLRRLVENTRQTANLSVLDGHHVLHLAVIEPETIALHYHTRIGAREPFYCTALGKVLAAHLRDGDLANLVASAELRARTPASITDRTALLKELAEVRRLGYAEDREEMIPGLRCIAAPVRDSTGEVVAAISISGPASELGGEHRERFLPILLATTRSVSERLGWVARD